MSKCATHKIKLVPQGTLSLVCPKCSYKIYRKEKYWLPEVRHVIHVPSGFLWSTFTLTGCETSGNSIVMSAGQVSATALSGRITQVTKQDIHRKDIRKVKIVSTETINDGVVQYEASNDGGSTWRLLKTQDAVFRLNRGKEKPNQSKYNDLRLRVTMTRPTSGDTSPQIDTVTITHSYKGDGQ